MDIKKKIREKLDEDLKQSMAHNMGLYHLSHDVWGDSQWGKYKWTGFQFEPIPIEKYAYVVTHGYDRGVAREAHVFRVDPDRDKPDEDTPQHFTKTYIGPNQKEVEKQAEAHKKAHNKIVREKRAAIKAGIVAKKEEVKAEKVAKKESVISRIQSFISPEITKIVNDLFEQQKVNVLENLKFRYDRLVNTLKGIEGMSPKDPDYTEVMGGRYKPTPAFDLSHRIMQHKKDKDSEYNGTYTPDYPLFFVPGYQKKIEKMIERDLEDITGAFLFKMESKLGEVIKSKKIKEFTSKGLHKGEVKIAFEDGSKFQVNNTIEMAVSKNNVMFNRFPCRFHDVTFSDGKFKKLVSEEDMKKDF